MGTKLDDLRTAFMNYLDEEIDNAESLKRCSITKAQSSVMIEDFVNGGLPAKAAYSAKNFTNRFFPQSIVEKRAKKLKDNLKKVLGENGEFDKEYFINTNCAKFIDDNFKDQYPPLELILEPIILPNNHPNKLKDRLLEFIATFPDGRKWLICDVNNEVELLAPDYLMAQQIFESTLGKDLDKSFEGGNIFSTTNTRKIFIEYRGDFKSFCQKMQSGNSKLSLCTGIVSYDLEDIFRGESIKNIFNMNQLTLFIKFVEQTGSVKVGALYDDVSPTSPPR